MHKCQHRFSTMTDQLPVEEDLTHLNWDDYRASLAEKKAIVQSVGAEFVFRKDNGRPVVCVPQQPPQQLSRCEGELVSVLGPWLYRQPELFWLLHWRLGCKWGFSDNEFSQGTTVPERARIGCVTLSSTSNRRLTGGRPCGRRDALKSWLTCVMMMSPRCGIR